MKIVVLEDHPGIRLALEMLLEWSGHQSVCFDQGDQAIEYLRWNHADFVLMDWNTPGLSGRAFLLALDEVLLPLFRPKVGVLSGDGDACWAVSHFGAEFFLMKPFQPEQVVQYLKGVA